MHKADKEPPSSFLALTVGVLIGAMIVMPSFLYACRVNAHLWQENQRLHIAMSQQAKRETQMRHVINLTEETIDKAIRHIRAASPKQ